MKKIIVIVLVIVLSGIAVYEVYNLFLKRTPEKLLKQQFNISLKDFDYSIETFEEQWCPNGDGELLIVIKFNELTQKNIEYFKSLDNIQPLPVSEMEYHQMGANKISKQLLKANTGYYIYQVGRIANWEEVKGVKMALDFKLFIVDTENNKAVLYYQFM